MASDPVDTLRRAPSGDAMPAAPLAGTKSQSMQRLQIGLFGLGTMILLVGLANIILTNAQQNQARVVPEAAPTVAAEAEVEAVSDPLADAGVVPDMPDESEAPSESGDAAPAFQP